MQRSFTAPAFDDNLRAFLEGKIPCQLFVLFCPPKSDSEFNDWLKGIAANLKLVSILRDLNSRFGILPAPVLLILAEAKFLLLTRGEPLSGNKRQRVKAIKQIDATLKVMSTYPAVDFALASDGVLMLHEMKHQGVAETYLETLKHAIGRIKPRKQSDVEMRFCVQALENFFVAVTRKSLMESVGELTKLAFPREWGASGDLRLAAYGRIKGSSINAKHRTVEEALKLQTRDKEHQQFWRKKKRELDLLLSRSRKKTKQHKKSISHSRE